MTQQQLSRIYYSLKRVIAESSITFIGIDMIKLFPDI